MKSKFFIPLISLAVILSITAVGLSLYKKPLAGTINNQKIEEPAAEPGLIKDLNNRETNYSSQPSKTNKVNSSNNEALAQSITKVPKFANKNLKEILISKAKPVKLITVKLSINTGQKQLSYSVAVPRESTVYTLLKTASKTNHFSLRVSNYSYGVFVEEIAGVSNNPSQSTYWLYYINGKLASVGCSNQKVKEGDDVLWNYEKT